MWFMTCMRGKNRKSEGMSGEHGGKKSQYRPCVSFNRHTCIHEGESQCFD